VGSAKLAAPDDPAQLPLQLDPYRGLKLLQSHRDVLYVFVDAKAPLTDEQAISLYLKHRETGVALVAQTASGIRSRRAELVKMGLLYRSGRDRLSTGNLGAQHRVFGTGAIG
jgi:hypothetical protein